MIIQQQQLEHNNKTQGKDIFKLLELTYVVTGKPRLVAPQWNIVWSWDDFTSETFCLTASIR